MNNFTKVSAATGGLALFLDLVPAQYAIYPAALVMLCAILRALIQPPAASSKWAAPYQIMSAIGANIGWALPRLRPGTSVVDVAREDKEAAKAAVASAGITPLTSKGKP